MSMDKPVTIVNILLTLLVIAIVAVLLTLIKNILIKKVAYRDKKKRNTLLGMIFNILQYVVIIAGIFAILTVNGINVTGMLAGLGVMATIVGLSLQDTFKDLFAGINIYSNNFYKVGDYVRYNGEICEVKFFNARISKFSSLGTNATYTVSNSTVYSIEKVKEVFGIKYIFDYEVDKKIVNKCLDKVAKEIDKMDGVKKAENLGITAINESGVVYTFVYYSSPKHYFAVNRAVADMAYDEFKKHGITPSFDEDSNVKGYIKVTK